MNAAGGRLHHQRKPWHKTKHFWSEKTFPTDVFATAETHFIFKGTYYNQVDGVAMCSPLAPILANLFMGHHEKICLEHFKDSKVLFHHCYVEDTFCLFNSEQDADLHVLPDW